MMNNQKLLAGICVAALFGGCGIIRDIKQVKQMFRDPSMQPMTETIKSILPAAYAASVAMAAVRGTVPSNVHMVQTFSSYPGNGLMYIDFDNAYPLTPPAGSTVKIGVAGLWSDSNQAILTIMFTAGGIKAGSMTISNVATVPVMRDSTGIRLVFAAEDINAGSDTLVTLSLSSSQIQAEWTRFQTAQPLDSSVAVTQLAWVVRVDNNHTPLNFTDDVYAIDGACQSVDVDPQSSDMQIVQLVMFGVTMSPSCRLNPARGYAIMKNTGLTSGRAVGAIPVIGTSVFTFHSTCNGLIDVAVATGVYVGANGKSLALHL
jgi:hypothetical protein